MDGFGLDDLAEDSEEEARNGKKRGRDVEEGLGTRTRTEGDRLARLSGSGRARQQYVEREVVRPGKGAGRGGE